MPNSLQSLIPSLGVSDIQRSLVFYRDCFGFSIVDSHESDGELVWCRLRSGGAELMLQQLTTDQLERALSLGYRRWVIYVRPENIKQVHGSLADAGHDVSEIKSTRYGSEECYVIDPDGYDIWISGPVEGGDVPDDKKD